MPEKNEMYCFKGIGLRSIKDCSFIDYNSRITFRESFIASSQWNNKKNKIRIKIRNLISNTKEDILKKHSHINKNEEFFIILIRDIFVFLKNNTDLLNRLNIIQLKEIPMMIYNIAKQSLPAQRAVYRETEFLETINNLYGFIYVSINTLTYKPYVGQTTLTIEEEWSAIKKEARALKKKREANPMEETMGRYIHNSIIKHGEQVWDLKLVDIAYDKTELDDSEDFYIMDVYDSLAPNGYNLRRGGSHGKHHPISRRRLSKSGIKAWRKPGHKDMMREIQSEVWNRLGYRAHQIEKRSEVWNRLGYRAHQIKKQSEVWNRPGHREMMREKHSEVWNRPGHREMMKERLSKAKKDSYKKKIITWLEISNIRKFLTDIKNAKLQTDVTKKYSFKSKLTLHRRIEVTLGLFGVRNYKTAKMFLQDRDIDYILEELKELGHIKSRTKINEILRKSDSF